MFYNVLSADAAATGGLGGMSSILFLVIIFVVFYFFQGRQEQEERCQDFRRGKQNRRGQGRISPRQVIKSPLTQ